MAALATTLIRQVEPTSLTTVAGWNLALRACRSGPGPRWQRGDIAVPVECQAGTVFPCADAWVRAADGSTRLVRNTAVLVDRLGSVYWLSSTSDGATVGPVGQSPSAWWWPTGGVTAGNSNTVVLLGERWHLAGTLTYDGASLAVLDLDAWTVSSIFAGLDASTRWGAPAVARSGGINLMATIGFDATTWGFKLATAPVLSNVGPVPPPWTVTDVTIESGPLAPPRLTAWRGGFLASGKILSSAPGFGYAETPEVAAWWSPTLAGPYKRLPDLVDDTTRPGWPSYAAGACWLPGAGLVASWSRNAEPWTVYDHDGYGPVFAPARLPAPKDMPQ